MQFIKALWEVVIINYSLEQQERYVNLLIGFCDIIIGYIFYSPK
jgi:hypothetical protein